MSSLEVLASQLEDHKNVCDRDKERITNRIEALEKSDGNKVTYKHFYWIIGILVSIQLFISGYIIQQNKDLGIQINGVDHNVSLLQGQVGK